MGRVWLARDEVLRRDVAIKQVALPFGLSDGEREELRIRTLREARAVARLNHPNVVKVYDVLHGEEQPWIVMEYVRSRSLLQVIEENGPLDVDQVAGIGLAILSALDAANRAGVLHRDVKPSNVLIADDGRVVLTDFGSAVIDESEGAITRTGVIIGSPQYISPERAYNGVSTPASDLWSLGATLYAAVEGRAPFARPTAMATLLALANKRPDPMRRAGRLKPVLNGLLQKKPEARMTAIEAEQHLRLVADVQTTVRLRRVPQQHRTSDSNQVVQSGWAASTALAYAGQEAAAAPAAPVSPPAPNSAGRLDTLAELNVDAVRDGAAAPTPSPTHDGKASPAAAVASAADQATPSATPGLAERRAVPWGRVTVAAVVVLVIALGAVAFRLAVAQRSSATDRTAEFPPAAATTPAGAGLNASATPRAVLDMPKALPAGLMWWNDQSGFSVPIPTGWVNQREGAMAMLFCERGGAKILRVRGRAPNDLDLMAAFRREEARAKMPGYHRIRMAIAPAGAAADWEYTFNGDVGKMRGLERAVVIQGRAYVMQWQVTPDKWRASLPTFKIITEGFIPPRVS